MAKLWLLKQNFKMAATAIFDFPGCKFWLQNFLWDVIFSVCMKFGGNICNNSRVIAVNVNFKMVAAAILDFVVCNFWRQNCFPDPISNPCVKFGANMCNSGRVIKISSKIQNGGCPPSWIIICYAGPPTKTTLWPEVCVQISWQSKQYFWSYRHLNISQHLFLAPKFTFLGAFDSQTLFFIIKFSLPWQQGSVWAKFDWHP